MAEIVESHGTQLRRLAVIGIGAFCAVLLAAAIALWAKLGTTVFFETIRAGLAYCF